MSMDMIPEPQSTLDNPARRVMLKGGAGAMAALGLMQMSPAALASSHSKVPEFAQWKRIEDLIIHSANTMETVRGAIRSGVITPSPTLFVRNNLPAPSASITENMDNWEVSFEGVKNPRSLKVSDLKKMGATTVASVLQCSGNGRAFFPHGAGGTTVVCGCSWLRHVDGCSSQRRHREHGRIRRWDAIHHWYRWGRDPCRHRPEDNHGRTFCPDGCP